MFEYFQMRIFKKFFHNNEICVNYVVSNKKTRTTMTINIAAETIHTLNGKSMV